MSKKSIIGIVIGILVVAIAICVVIGVSHADDGYSKADENVTHEHFIYGKKTVEAIDKYLDWEATAVETLAALSDITGRKEGLPNVSEEEDPYDKNYYIVMFSEFLADNFAEIAVSGETSELHNEIMTYRDDIAKYIGIENR